MPGMFESNKESVVLGQSKWVGSYIIRERVGNSQMYMLSWLL